MTLKTWLVFFGLFFEVLIPFVFSAFITKQINLPTKWNFTEYDKLRQDLLSTYDKQVRPAKHNETLVVSINFSVMDVEINELKSTITCSAWMPVQWIDEKLRWSPDSYGGLKQLHLSHNEMWKPDLFLHNSPLSIPIALFGSRHLCVVSYNGAVLCVPSVQMTALCDLNLKYWPFDEHECKFKIASWTHTWDLIDLRVTEGVDGYLRDDLLRHNSEWKIINASQIRNLNIGHNLSFDVYHDVTLTFHLARQPTGYKLIVFTSAFVVMCLLLISFCLWVQSDSKMIVSIVSSLIGCLFLLYFGQKLPPLRTNTPLIVSFFNANLYLASFAVAETAFLMWLLSTSHCRRELPWILKKYIVGKLGSCFGLLVHPIHVPVSRDNEDKMNDSFCLSCYPDQDKNKVLKRRVVHHNYVILAAVIDRIFFFIYTIIYFVLAIRYYM